VTVTLSPADRNGQAGGTTQFTRVYVKGTEVTLSADSTSESNQFKQWLKNEESAGTNPTVAVTMNHDLTVRAVYMPKPVSPKITQQPSDIETGLAGTFTLSVHAEGPTDLRYQWFKNDQPIAGATTQDYTVKNVAVDDQGIYKVVINTDFGQAESGDAVVTVGTGVRVSVDSEGLATIYLRTEIDGIWRIEESSDLKEWTEVNAIKTTNGEAETTDIRSLINESRFYRARFLE
jgi:hypothetical protein